jgi:phage baseplate assembly protein W
MPITGFRGISFPFRVNTKGGIAMSSCDIEEIPHIIESIMQILNTHRLERSMEYHIFSDSDEVVFEPNDVSAHTLLKYDIEQALRLDPRIEVTEVLIISDDNYLYADIHFTVLLYQKYYESGRIKIGEVLKA